MNRNLTINLIRKVPRLGESLNYIKTKSSLFFFNKKILLVISLIFFVSFAYSLKNTKNSQVEEESAKRYQDIRAEIEQKQNQAESSLIYNNDQRAKELFDEISKLLQELPKETEEQKESYEDFKTKFNAQLEKIRRISRTEGTALLIDFSQLSSNANVQNLTYSNKTNRLYSADPTNKSIHIFDLNTQISTTLTSLENDIRNLDKPLIYSENNQEKIYYLNIENLIALDTETEEFSTIGINIENPDAIGGIGFYGTNLYLADKKNNQIYRYQNQNQSYGSGNPWLSETVDMSTAVGLAIDGNIFVLNKNGTITKLLRGVVQDFKLGLCDPPLEEVDKISISQEKDFLYILEAKNNRLLVYDKSGQFIMQYQGENLNNLKDFLVIEEKSIIYFLNGSEILELKATHFES